MARLLLPICGTTIIVYLWHESYCSSAVARILLLVSCVTNIIGQPASSQPASQLSASHPARQPASDKFGMCRIIDRKQPKSRRIINWKMLLLDRTWKLNIGIVAWRTEPESLASDDHYVRTNALGKYSLLGHHQLLGKYSDSKILWLKYV